MASPGFVSYAMLSPDRHGADTVRHTRLPPPHALADYPLPGIDPGRLSRLEAGGIGTLEDLVEAGPARLAELTGFDRKTSVALVEVAQGALARANPGVVEFAPRTQEAAATRLARGLEAAREIEGLLGLVRKARSHAGRTAPKEAWRRDHHRARRQLRKLLAALEAVQEDVLADGLSAAGYRHLQHRLTALEPLRELVSGPITGKALRRLRKRAKRARHALTERRR